jgi:hypothetical protein
VDGLASAGSLQLEQGIIEVAALGRQQEHLVAPDAIRPAVPFVIFEPMRRAEQPAHGIAGEAAQVGEDGEHILGPGN